ncbi:acyl-CoA N-acyltransferase [Acephala macrosclerotiorum]|nr:acyl-CoA N-acyltransferase [Acephala macrosclerotiorum]
MSNGVFYYEQRKLENDLVALEPFNPSIHAAPFVEAIGTNPEVLTYIAFPVIKTKEDFMREFYDKDIRSSPEECLYAVIDKVSVPEAGKTIGKYAGIISLSVRNPVNAVVDMGAIIFPAFQRTHVATNAIGLLLFYMLDPPSAGGLGLRRVEWKCHAGNQASRKAALRMGFEFEGIARWQCVFPRGNIALPVEALEKRNGTKGELPGRHTAIFSIVWDEWDEKRLQVVTQLERTS